MVSAVYLGKKLNSRQSWLTFIGRVETVRSEKIKKSHNLEGIFILALYYPLICFEMSLKYQVRIPPSPALVLEQRWHCAGFKLVQLYQGMRFLGAKVENNLPFNVLCRLGILIYM